MKKSEKEKIEIILQLNDGQVQLKGQLKNITLKSNNSNNMIDIITIYNSGKEKKSGCDLTLENIRTLINRYSSCKLIDYTASIL